MAAPSAEITRLVETLRLDHQLSIRCEAHPIDCGWAYDLHDGYLVWTGLTEPATIAYLNNRIPRPTAGGLGHE